jgi:hypothetical protein
MDSTCKPVHIWEVKGGWEISMSDSTVPLTRHPTRGHAIDWCQNNAGDLGATVIFVWEMANLVRK